MANGAGFGPVRVIQEYRSVIPKCHYIKNYWISSERALLRIQFYMEKYKNPTNIFESTQGTRLFTLKNTRGPLRAHHFTWKRKATHQEPTIVPGKKEGARQEPTILLGKTQRATIYLKTHQEHTICLENTRSPPEAHHFTCKKKNPTWHKWQRWKKKPEILQRSVLYYSVLA